MNNYVLLKLITCEQIIAKLIDQDSFSIIIEDPVEIKYSVNYDNNTYVAAHKYMDLAENNLFTLSKNHVILNCIPSIKSVDQYEKFLKNEQIQQDSLALDKRLIN